MVIVGCGVFFGDAKSKYKSELCSAQRLQAGKFTNLRDPIGIGLERCLLCRSD